MNLSGIIALITPLPNQNAAEEGDDGGYADQRSVFSDDYTRDGSVGGNEFEEDRGIGGSGYQSVDSAGSGQVVDEGAS